MVVGGRELIDTLWNVKYFADSAESDSENELIDTLWNVKTEKCIKKLTVYLN